MLQIGLNSIDCIQTTPGDDEPYVLVASVAVPPTPAGSPIFPAGPADVTLYVFSGMNEDSRPPFTTKGHRWQPCWGVGTLPATVADTANSIIIVALMENDEGNPHVVRSAVLAAVWESLIRTFTLPRAGKVTPLMSNVDSARNFPSSGGALVSNDNPIGGPQELIFSLAELQQADGGKEVVKALSFAAGNTRYTLTFVAYNPEFEDHEPIDPPMQFGTGVPDYQQGLMQAFRTCATAARGNGFEAGFPNFNYRPGPQGLGFVGESIFLTKAGAETRDVPLSELKLSGVAVELGNFWDRLKAANVYASGQEGFVGGFPTYFHADYGKGIVCGTVLIKEKAGMWEDVPLADLGNPALTDVQARFKGTQAYAGKSGFIGGFPNLFHAKQTVFSGIGRPTSRIVCGTVLIRSNYIDIQVGGPVRTAVLREVIV